MSNYVQSTNFATKDALSSGDPLKIVKGTEINIEFNNIATAVATKADLISPVFTGTPSLPTGTTAVTQASGDNSTAIATTAFVNAAISPVALLYPIGSVYINATDSTNPSTLLGFGTWSAFGAGRVMAGFDSTDPLFDAAEETGGSKDAALPSHAHTFSGTTSSAGTHQHDANSGVPGIGEGNPGPNSVQQSSGSELTSSAGSHNHTYSGTTASAGVSATNANLQPYITVYLWKRTA